MREGVRGLEAQEDVVEGRSLLKLAVSIEGGGGGREGQGRGEKVGKQGAVGWGIWRESVQVMEKPQEAVCQGWWVRWLKGLV